MLSLHATPTAGYGLMIGVLGHLVGWPMARGGSAAITAALISILESHGGKVECNHPVRSLDELPSARATLLDVTPRQLVAIAGDRHARSVPSPARVVPVRTRSVEGGLGARRTGAVDEPRRGTAPRRVHLGGTLAEIAASEDEVQQGRNPERPFVLFVQQTPFDHTRAPEGKHTAWAYCHVPNGSELDMTDRIEAQVERFAPGFRDRIIARHVMGPGAMQQPRRQLHRR